MEKQNNNDNKLLFVCIGLILSVVFVVSLFNYIVDPYFVFRDSAIKGFNNVKTYKYVNKRTILYSDIKINSKKHNAAFIGNCLITRFGDKNDNVGFYIIPVATVKEVAEIFDNITEVVPHIKKIYWGTFFGDLWYEKNEEVTDVLSELKDTKASFKDYLNLFFSWNTTKYSILTVRDSIKNKGKDIVYIYPYKEIAAKKYDKMQSFDDTEKIKHIVDRAKQKGVELTVYYSPLHISEKAHVFLNNAQNKEDEYKRRLASITPFYDYSLLNEYNTPPLDENSEYFIDNLHPTDIYNNMIIRDLLSDSKKIGVLTTKENVEELIKENSEKINEYISRNAEFREKIKHLNASDASVKILRKESSRS